MVYGYRDYIGSLRIISGAYQNDAVQDPADGAEDPYDGGEDPADEIEIPADGFEDYAGGIEVPPEDEPMTVAVD